MTERDDDENEQIAQRRAKLAALREQGSAFPNDFRRDALAGELQARFAAAEEQTLAAQPQRVRIAGRMMTRRVMGKASFAHLQDMSGAIQIYLRRDDLPQGAYAEFKRWDIGDIIGVEGVLFRTKTGELSVQIESLRLLTKALRPLPEKYHGLADTETRYRQRYLDLIMSEPTRRAFRMRSAVISQIRAFLGQRGYLEVETPMMHTIPGGAAARPFKTHHNALGMDLYLRIAPELYLKRLVVGGFEKVYEINRSFRNEGLSTRHNPEFTMLEFYEAYADYNDLMDLTEEMLRSLAAGVLGAMELRYQDEVYDFGQPFRRLTVQEAILEHNSSLGPEDLETLEAVRGVAKGLGIALKPGWGLGKAELVIFEHTAEPRLRQPTFVTAYPTEVSPLARRNDVDPGVTDRFELFVGGQEIANGFSELNDAEDQAQRFRRQVEDRDAGDLEAMHYDADYVTALEHGLPPTAGEGVGIDRLVMLLTDSPSIRDVLLFPHMRPEQGLAAPKS